MASGENGDIYISNTPEIKGPKFVKTYIEAVGQILERFNGLFEINFDRREDYLDYHTADHSLNAAVGASQIYAEVQKILGVNDSFQITKEQGELTIKAFGHDIVQNSIIDQNTGMRMRIKGVCKQDLPKELQPDYPKKRGNEELSAMLIYNEIKRYRYFSNEARVFEITYPSILRDIAGTYPIATLEPLPGTKKRVPKITQPYLRKTSIQGFILATEELRGGCGRGEIDETTNVYLEQSDREFWELYPGLRQALLKYRESKDEISLEQKQKLIEEIFNWTGVNEGFALWQKILFEQSLDEHEEINKLPEDTRAKLKALFIKEYSKFEVNAESGRLRFEEAQRIMEKPENTEAEVDAKLDKMLVVLKYLPEQHQKNEDRQTE